MKKFLKKLLVLAPLATALVAPAQTQQHQSQGFLNCLSLSVTNTGGYTNISSYFGQDNRYTTNAGGLMYSNTTGTWVLDYLSNTNTGITVQSNGVINNTNDLTQVTHDVLYHADGLGNATSNYNISFAMIGNANMGAGAGSNILVTFAPLVKGGTFQGPNVAIVPPILGSAGPGTLLDLSGLFTLTVATRASSNYVSTVTLNPTNIIGYKGLRLLSISITNSTGQIWFPDISLNSFGP